jgi:hypothetical protein
MQPYSRPASRRASDLFWGLTTQHVRHASDDADEEARAKHGGAGDGGTPSGTTALHTAGRGDPFV